jgi:hypothetical protein
MLTIHLWEGNNHVRVSVHDLNTPVLWGVLDGVTKEQAQDLVVGALETLLSRKSEDEGR